ncbi:MAG TPA: nucleoside-diphosphate sugar epimerase/dehydratase [Methylomirabilota bacterium]|nr:nucleoside-diphosphate sugar epimerase/dehydratase [Methylomirabilota bacterium]
MKTMLIKYRRFLIVGFHLALMLLSNYLAFWLRFDGAIPPGELAVFIEMLPWLVVIRGLIFVPLRLYEGLWRYTGIWELRNVIIGATASAAAFYILVHWMLERTSYPVSIFIIDTLLLIVMMGGSRLAQRLYFTLGRMTGSHHVLIYGAGDAGEMIVRDMKNGSAVYHYEPVGFVDDNPAKVGQHIHGVPVLGSGREIARIIEAHRPDEILLAMPSASGAQVRKIMRQLATFKVPIKTLPQHAKLPDGKVAVSQIQSLSIEDLLDRPPVGLDPGPVRKLMRGKRVLITGAGGSIGSELGRQIARYEPGCVILLDNAESALYDISMELQRSFPALRQAAVLADIKSARSLEKTFAEHGPQIVFHAAAYKHVPMMENYPAEAVLNNVVGTHRMIQLALGKNVEKFILISTDKAVNPTNVMGATKRLCEMYVQALAKSGQRHDTVFAAVRFGNVLGSNGSVVPLFLKQIAAGGPVTITDPEVTRYFMTIPEAVQLVLQSAALARSGEIFVLEMGEQLKLIEIARHLIRLAGFIPDEEIAIEIVGLRPGEKLREELVAMDEAIVSSEADAIKRVQSAWIADLNRLTETIEEMERLALNGQSGAAAELLYEMVPTFRSVDANLSEQPGRGEAAMKGWLKWRIAKQAI